jgi:hypothetical protein
MPALYEIRADYDKDTITLYQAYSRAIALPALEQQRFAPPFSLNRMTWIKPSFLWMMERSNWGRKPGQEYILAVKISRTGWEEALSHGVLTAFEPIIHRSYEQWQNSFENALVHIQWDPERTIRGASLHHKSIQVGISRYLIQKYVNEWIVEIKDCSPLVKKLYTLVNGGQADKAASFLPKERVYPLDPNIAHRLGMV